MIFSSENKIEDLRHKLNLLGKKQAHLSELIPSSTGASGTIAGGQLRSLCQEISTAIRNKFNHRNFPQQEEST